MYLHNELTLLVSSNFMIICFRQLTNQAINLIEIVSHIPAYYVLRIFSTLSMTLLFHAS